MRTQWRTERGSRSRRRRVVLSLLGILGLVVAVLSITTARWFLWPSDDQPTSADAVVVFAGGTDGDRLATALELMTNDVAPTLVISAGNERWFRGPELSDICENGSPEYRVVCLIPEPDSTIGEAAAFAHLAEQEGWQHLVAVSSDWHLHRAQRWLDRCFPGATSVVGADSPRTRDIIVHEMAGTAHAILINRHCPTGPYGQITSDLEPAEASPAAAPISSDADGATPRVESLPRDPALTECQDWIGRRFLMSVYSVPVEHPDTRSVAELAAEGFTHVGPWYEDDRWSSGSEAASSGLCTIFPVGASVSIDDALANPSQALEAVQADLERALADPELNASISAWSILPEELNIYRDGHTELFEQLVRVVDENDPLQRRTYSYLQSNADERQFEVANQLTGVVGQGNYLSTNGYADQRVYLRASIERGLAARAATNQATDAVMPVIEHRIHSGVLDPADSPLIEAWVRHDIFTTLAAGADGFISFSGFPPDQGLDDFARYNDAYTTVVAEVIDEGFLELYANGSVDSTITATVESGPAELEIPVLFVPQRDNPTETFSSVAVRAWVLDGDHTVVVVNHSNETVTVRVEGDDYGPAVVVLEPLGVQILRG